MKFKQDHNTEPYCSEILIFLFNFNVNKQNNTLFREVEIKAYLSIWLMLDSSCEVITYTTVNIHSLNIIPMTRVSTITCIDLAVILQCQMINSRVKLIVKQTVFKQRKERKWGIHLI